MSMEVIFLNHISKHHETLGTDFAYQKSINYLINAF